MLAWTDRGVSDPHQARNTQKNSRSATMCLTKRIQVVAQAGCVLDMSRLAVGLFQGRPPTGLQW
jgi:hypothetical protein